MDIPVGETRSYRQIADHIGAPKAVRAVGRACASNPVSLLVPCHRAVGSDGSLRGYRWGLARKQRLLDHEAT
jgi:AraC family transcriptional regulator of adaptative response/methylated-DNA-[protein]-cysteine methyltransferase